KMVQIAKQNAIEAGLADLIEWKQMAAQDFHPKKNNGYLISNPPYGERLSDQQEDEQLYRKLGQTMKQNTRWSNYILTANEDIEKLYGKKATKKRKLFNGFIKVDYYQYFGKFIKKDD